MKKAIKSSFDLGTLKGRALGLRDQIRGRDSRADEARSAAKDARRSVRSTARGVRRGARSQYVRARVAAARATAPRRTRTDRKKVAAAGAAGAAGAYFLDPQVGARRRDVARDKMLSLIRKGSGRARREAEYRKSQAGGRVEALKSKARPDSGAPNDQTLAERVKSEIFQPADAPKGTVSVNVERGVVYLRGEVPKQKDIEKLVKQADSVDGVNGVESLLHTG
ncbi:MAG TPA: BON domain-containing protein [Pyrinomonadaceae bacterium]